MKWEGPDSYSSWLVAATTCFISTIFFGIQTLSSFFFVDSITRYQVSREAASFPYTFCGFTLHLSGLLVGWLAPKLGPRLTTCIGCFLASLGVSLCFLAESIHVITIMWGIVCGLGCSFCLHMLPVFIIQYFDKQRGIASAVSGLGMSLGAFLMSPLYEVLMESYGLSGTFLILSGFLLNTIPAAMLLRKPNFIIKRPNLQSKKSTEESQQFNFERRQLYCEDNSFNDAEVHVKTTTIKQDSSVPAIISTPKSKIFPTTGQYDCQVLSNQRPLPKYMDNVSKSRRNPRNFQSFKVLFDPVFILISITSTQHMFLLLCFGTILVDFAKDIGIHEDDLKYIPISNALGDLFGRLCLGWVADRRLISNSALSALAFLGQGVLQLSICWSRNVYIYLGILMLSGFLGSALLLVKPLISDEFFKREEQIMVLSSSTFFTAPLSLCISPMIGYFRGNLGSYIYMLYCISALQFLGGLLWIMTPYFVRYRRTQAKETSAY